MIICSPQLGISPESNLGGEVYDRELLKALADLGVNIYIILPFGKKYQPHKNFHIYYLPIPFVWPPYLFNVLILPYLIYIYFRHHFEILRVHSPYFIGPGAVLFGMLFPKIRLVASYLHLEDDNYLYSLIDKILIRHFTSITTISEFTKNEIFQKYGVISWVIPCGVDKKYKPRPKNLDLVNKFGLQNRKVLLYFGQLIERKNIPFLFKVIKLLPKKYVLMICGDGPLRLQLQKSTPKGVIFTGKILEDQKVEYYNLADVFVYPSLKEGFGLSVAEAMACGKPVVASNVPIVDNTALDPILWAKKIQKFKTRKYIKYRWSESAKRYLGIFKNKINE